MSSRAFVAATCTIFLGVSIACSQDPRVARDRFVASGDRYVAQQKYAEAVLEYRNAVTRVPESGEALFKLASAYEKLGDMGSALREYVRAADLMPSNSE